MYTNAYDKIANYGLEVSRGNVVNAESLYKFGLALDVDTGDGEIDIWDGSSNGLDNKIPLYNWITTPTELSIVCTDNDFEGLVLVDGLDEEGLQKTTSVILTGHTPVVLEGSWLAINRAYNDSDQEFVGDFIYIFDSSTSTSSGVPVDDTSVRGIIQGIYNQTQMGVYTVPYDRDLYIFQAYAHLSKQSSSEALVKIYKSPSPDKVFRLINTVALQTTGSSGNHRPYPVPYKVPAGYSMRYTAEVFSNNSAVTAGFQGMLVKEGDS